MTALEATWNSQRLDRLKTCFDAGLSCGQIAGEIGVTRNAVIGKLFRLGLSRPRALRLPPPERTAPARTWRPRIATQHQTQHQILQAVRAAPAPAEEAAIHDGPGCSLMELSAEKCRWPISDPSAADFRFCGSRPVKGLPYCVHHARMAYQPTNRQRGVRA